ncbi:MAG TPA: DUF4157 domain-containing protein [Puia sp.]|uniref:eCIS core domain-containing protein n=1 Tax=Puia sp. TaxID=2045100 RepID=UPI002C9CB309|nr:DUF4157 domain-containing protein [Puia sp.]HVU99488.1 DUF4157 domain-containing protein [Puia sp.]
MKTRATKTPATQAKKNDPFFQKEGKGEFFGSQPAKGGFFRGRTAGGGVVQPKLTVGQPNDGFEKEADAMADKVVQRKCAECEKEEKVRKKPIFESEADPKEEVRRKPDSSGAPPVTPAVESGIRSSKGGGAPLPAATRRQMESGFGADFSGVRIHNDGGAREMSKDLNAQAFTHGKDIYFNSGKYDPASTGGQKLLAHELTHVVQQGGGVVKRKEAGKNLTADHSKGATTPDVQRDPSTAPTGGSDGSSSTAGGSGPTPPPGPPYKIPDATNPQYILDPSKQDFEIVTDGLPLPTFKARNADKFKWPLYFAAGRPETTQESKWKDAVKTEADAALEAFLTDKDKKVPGQIYFLKSLHSDYTLMGTVTQLRPYVYLPDWDRTGQPRTHQIDHILEMQLGGGDEATNYELLDSKANNLSGRALQDAIGSRIRKGIKALKDAGVTAAPEPMEVLGKENPKYIVQFHKSGGWNLGVGGNGDAYWSLDEIKKGSPLKQLRGMTLDEVHAMDGSDKILLVFVKANSGKPHRFTLPVASKNNWLPGVDLQSLTVTNPKAADNEVMGTMSIRLGKTITDKFGVPSDLTINFVKIPGLVNAGSLELTAATQKLANVLKFKGLSPVTVNQFDITDNGLVLSGFITADVPLIKDSPIDFSVDGNDIRISKTFNTGEIKSFPKPFVLNDVSLSIFASTEYGFGVSGNIDFAIQGLGKGSVTGIGATKDGFGVKGEFVFDSERFKGSSIGFTYAKEKWSIKGKLVVPPGSGIKGVDHGSLAVVYDDGTITADGDVVLTVPGIDKATLHAVFGEGGAFSIGGDITLKSMPGIKSGGKVSALISKAAGAADYSLSVTGEVEPNLPNIPKMNPKLTISYVDGLFKAEGKSDFGTSGGMITGDVTVGVTNGTVVDGKLQPGEGGKKISFYGNGTLHFIPFKGVDASITVKVDTTGKALFSFNLDVHVTPFDELKKDITLLDIQNDIPLVGVPFLSLNLHVGLKAVLYLRWLPLTIGVQASITDKTYEELIAGKFSSDFALTVETSGKVGIDISVDAGVSAKVAVLVGGATLGGDIKLEADPVVKGELDATWEGDKGLKLKGGKGTANVDLNLILALHGRAFVDLDLVFSRTNLWEKVWVLAESKPKTLYSMGIEAPFEFDDNNNLKPFDPSKVKFLPDLDKDKAKEQGDKGVNPDGDKGKQQDDNTIQSNIRKQIADNLREKSKDKSIDIHGYAAQLRENLTKNNDPKLAGFVSQAVDEELKKIDAESNPQGGDSSADVNPPVSRKPMEAAEGDVIQTKPDKPAKGGTQGKAAKAPPPDIKLNIDMALPKEDPEPDYRKSWKDLKAWEIARLQSHLKAYSICEHVMKDGKEWSFVSEINWIFEKPEFIYEIANEILRGTKRELEKDEISGLTDPTTDEVKHAFIAIDIRIRKHSKEHFARFRQVIKDEEAVLQQKLTGLPDKNSPRRMEQKDLESYMMDYMAALVTDFQHRIWKITCDLERRDYPTLLSGIYEVHGIFEVTCDKDEPQVLAEPILVTASGKPTPVVKPAQPKIRRQPEEEEKPAPQPPPKAGKYQIRFPYEFGFVELSEDPAHVRHQLEEEVIHHGRESIHKLREKLSDGLNLMEWGTTGKPSYDAPWSQPSPSYGRRNLSEHEEFQLQKGKEILAVVDATVKTLDAEFDQFIGDFYKLQEASALKILKISKERAGSEMIRYGLVPGYQGRKELFSANKELPAFKGMQLGAQMLLERRDIIDAKKSALNSLKWKAFGKEQELVGFATINAVSMINPDTVREFQALNDQFRAAVSEYVKANQELDQLKEAYNKVLLFLSGEYPVLGKFGDLDPDDHRSLATIANEADPYDVIATVIGSQIAYQLENIQECEKAIDKGKLNFWRLPNVVQFNLFQMGADQDPVKKRLIEDKVAVEQPGWAAAAALIIMDVVATLLAAPTGGVSLGIAAGVNLAVVHHDVEEYFLQKVEANTDFDKAHSLSANDPSVFWLALSLASAIPAVTDLAKAFKMMKVAVKGIRAARNTAALIEAEEAVRAIGKQYRLEEHIVEDIVRKAESEEAALKAVGFTEKETGEMKGLKEMEEHVPLVEDMPGRAVQNSKKVKVSLRGDLYGCASPCTLLREKYAKHMANDPGLLKEFEELEKDAKKAVTEADRTSVEKRALEWEKKAQNVQLASWKSPLSERPDFEELVKKRGSRGPELTSKPEGWTGKMEARFRYGEVVDKEAEEGYRWVLTEDGTLRYDRMDESLPKKFFDPETGEFKILPEKSSKFPLESTEELEKMATVGKGAKNFKEWAAKLRKSIPKLNEVSDEGIVRVLEKGPDIDHMKGQLLEELGASAARKSKLAKGAEFIEGHRITDAAGKQLTDGIMVKRGKGNIVEITGVAESKAGHASAEGLNRSHKSFNQLGSSELKSLQDEAVEEYRLRRGLTGEDELAPGRMPDWAKSENVLKDNKDEIEAIMREIHGSDMGQIEKDFERLTPNHGEEYVTILIDGQPYRAKATMRARIMTITPSDVPFEAAEALTNRNIATMALDVGIKADELVSLARQLRAEKVINGADFL